MKHFFYIHSNITLLVAQQTIKEQQLDEGACCFFFGRGFGVETGTASWVFPCRHLPQETLRASVIFWQMWRRISIYDAWLSSIAEGEQFRFYTPQSGMNFFYVTISHPLCEGYCYIEEGRGSYFRQEQLLNTKEESKLRDLLYFLSFKGRSHSVKQFFDFKNPKYRGSFGLSPHTFPDTDKKTILGNPFQKKNFEGSYKDVLVPEPLVEYGIVSSETFRQTIDYFLAYANKNKITTIKVKYHPAQEESIEIMRHCFSKTNIKAEELPAELSLEELAVSTEADFYIITSSVGIYASLAGRKVYSLAKKVAELEGSYQKAIDDLPDFFRENLIFV